MDCGIPSPQEFEGDTVSVPPDEIGFNTTEFPLPISVALPVYVHKYETPDSLVTEYVSLDAPHGKLMFPTIVLGWAGTVSCSSFKNDTCGDVQPEIDASTVYETPTVAPEITPFPPILGPTGENVYDKFES
jgi:hypothetical protein